MELTPKFLLEKYQLKPSKRLGQNFLVDKKALKTIIGAAELQPNDVILEVGPGLGTLTQELGKLAKKVIAIEKDPKMCEILKETLRNFKNVEIINEDILKIEELQNYLKIQTSRFAPCNYGTIKKNYKVVANLPYYITSPVIRKFLESENPPKEMVLMVQKEVAQRICAKPPKMSLLAVSIQFYSKPEIISYVKKESFWPSPKVDSAILRIAPLINADKKLINVDLFFKIVKAGFSQPRKQLVNNLSNGLALSLPNGLKLSKEQVKSWLTKNNIQPNQRAETLTIKDWVKLTKSVNC